MTHLLPGGGVSRVHGAWGPVPPRLPHFATPWSVRHLATMVAGAYPPRRPPNASPPGVPAPPGPCYWLVANRTPSGWRGGCLALGLVRGTVCHYCLGGCSALVVCARRSGQVRGVGAGAGSRVPPLPPPLRPPFSRCVWQVGLSKYAVSSPAGTPFHAVCAFRGLCLVTLQVRVVCPFRVCALALLRRSRPAPLPGSVWRAHHARFRGRAPVGPFQAVRAPQRFLPRSRAPFLPGFLPSLPPRAWLWVARPLVGGPVRPGRSGTWGVWGGGAIRSPPPLGGLVGCGSVGGPRGAGGGGSLCLGPSLCLY